MSNIKENLSPMEELKGLLMEAAGKQDEIKQGQEEARETIAKYEEQFGSIKDRLSQLETLGVPTIRKPQELALPIAGESHDQKMYSGYDLGMQGLGLKNLVDMDARSPFPLLQGRVGIIEPAKRETYAKYLIDILKAKLEHDPDAIRRLRDMQVKTTLTTSTAATAGYLVPDEYMAEILAFARLSSVCMRDCTIVPMASDAKRVPAEATNVAVAWEADDTSAFDESNPIVSEVVLNAKRLGAFTTVTNDLLDDSMIDIVSWLTSQFAEALGLEIDNQVFAGTGTPVSGLTTAACGYSVTLAGSISTVTGTKLSEMISKLSSNKTVGAKFYMNRSIFHYIRTLQDSQSAFIYNPIGQNQSNTIWGYPCDQAEKMPTTDGTGKPIALFGNLRYFYIGNRRQASSLDADPYGLFTSAQTRFRIYWRMALATGLNTAFVRLLTA